MSTEDQLAYVRHALAHSPVPITVIKAATGVSYDTLMRIKNEPDKSANYDTVLALYRHFKAAEQKAAA